MSEQLTSCSENNWRLVGDPVDVVTGANTERTLDFRLVGPLEFKWLRYYDSSKAAHPLALGFGHTHHFDRKLRFDVDGISYIAPVGWRVGFAPLVEDGAESRKSGLVLRRFRSTAIASSGAASRPKSLNSAPARTLPGSSEFSTRSMSWRFATTRKAN